jgi:hypothetical protein
MARDHDREPGRAVIGADMAEGLTASRTGIDLFEVGAEEMALSAPGAALKEAANHRLLRRGIGYEYHDGKMVRPRLWKKTCRRRAAIWPKPAETLGL